jgi:hypothetical protein
MAVSSPWALITEIEIGVVCRSSLRFCAVTVIVSSPSASALTGVGAGAGASEAKAVLVSERAVPIARANVEILRM